MSFPEWPVTLSPEAQDDLTDILRHTGERWGQGQLLSYRDKLNDALLSIACNPQIGRRDPALPEAHRLYFVSSHVIAYRTHGDSLEVLRILRRRMSIVWQLD
jgi:plasmid stabilization system protein ParE